MNDKVFAASIDKRFKKDKNPHKYVLLWTTKFYKYVNGCMRNKSVDDKKQDFPHAIYFIQNYIRVLLHTRHSSKRHESEKTFQRLQDGI